MTKILVLLFLVLSLGAQTLPNYWLGAGLGYNSKGSPKTTEWASFAALVNQTGQIYSYSSYDASFGKGRVLTTSTRTGVATVLKQYGRLYILGFGQAGTAQTNGAFTSSFSGGGMAFYRRKNDFTFEFGARIEKNGSISSPRYEFGAGKVW